VINLGAPAHGKDKLNRYTVYLEIQKFMDSKIIALLSEEIRETKNLTLEVREEVKRLERLAIAAERKAEAAWELVILTREQMNKPFWRRWFQ